MLHLRDELTKKYPELAKNARDKGRTAAVKLFCLECCGAVSKNVEECSDRACWLYLYRFGSSASYFRKKLGHIDPETETRKNHIRCLIQQKHPITTVLARSRSRRKAVHFQCLECIGYSFKRVKECSDKTCWLYPYRRADAKEIDEVGSEEER